MSHRIDLRIRVISYIENGGGILSAARIYKVGRSTIYRWLDRGDLKPIKLARRQRKLDWKLLEQDVKDNPDLRLCDRAQKFGVNISSIGYALRQMKITEIIPTALAQVRVIAVATVVRTPVTVGRGSSREQGRQGGKDFG